MRKPLLIVASAVAAVTLSSCALANQETHRDCTVTKKDTLYSSTEGNSTRDLRVSTTCGVFTVEDAFEVGQFDSYDHWAELEEGKTFDILTGSYRFGFFSMFPIVLAVDPS